MITLSSASMNFGNTKLGESIINVSNLKSTINYKEYNTDAKADVGCFGISMGK